ncbi:MAG: T9SS type A sorting domain-containing protein, partial [Cytophagaceae bacterium]
IDLATTNTAVSFKRSNSYPLAGTNGGYWRDKVPSIPFCLPVKAQCRNSVPETYCGILLGDVVDMKYTPGSGTVPYPTPDPVYPTGGGDPALRTSSETVYMNIDLKYAQFLGDNTYRVALTHSLPESDTLLAIDFFMDYDQSVISVKDVIKGPATLSADVNMLWNDYNQDELLLTSYTVDRIPTTGTSYYLDLQKPGGETIKAQDLGTIHGLLNGTEFKVGIDNSTSATTATTPAANYTKPYLTVVPNPVTGNGASKINYAISNGNNHNRIVITDVLGRVVGEYTDLPDNGIVDLDTSHLAEGMYFCTAYGSYGFKMLEKFNVIK